MSKTISIVIMFSLIFTFFAPAQQGEAAGSPFDDVAGMAWAEESVSSLSQQGIINGYEDGTFRPNNNISRQEAAVMMVRAVLSDEESGFQSDYTDVDTGSFYYEAISAASEYALFNGYPDGTFRPQENITRAESANILVSAFNFTGSETVFSDVNGHWAESDITALLAKGITTGYPDGTYKPGSSITRAEFAVLVDRSLKDEGVSVQREILRLTNEEREAHDLEPLKPHINLQAVADAKAEDMYVNDYFAHQSPEHGSPFDMMKAAGISYSAAAENIARGYHSAETVVGGWMDSYGHRNNILSERYTHLGVGYTSEGARGPYYVQMFIEK
ncbi:S-layer homology domain-containing protein [Alkalicoccus halolimnae]|uniref:S-layer homology domain-containing protein n=1 Tax=Alkalicoccus halolimnae TaxID=1667239 RepID=A0A5C7F5H3_9BACI|nr:S-layer homology domain-containing protein [Alkalicoccus halolimnae]TXF83935.1 hypothetical protein FTX54_11635 [Alkalicoccus halolimnae]